MDVQDAPPPNEPTDHHAPPEISPEISPEDAPETHPAVSQPSGYDPNHELLHDLTEPQREAVTHVDGPLLVIAGPGSGKTRVITRRIAYLVRDAHIAPWNVLAITFTNKAAGEMRERVGELLSEKQANATTIATFHSLCARLIRIYAERLGLPPGYSIYDTSDQKAAMKQALSDLEVSKSNFSPAAVLGEISNAKNELIDEEAYAQSAGDFYSRTIARLYTKYQQILTRNHALDFDDLLIKTVHLFRDHADILAELRDRYQYVLIDEYQDTNRAQFMIANALAREHTNLCATGDPDQSIYAWRGANIRNILDFESHYPDAKVVRLEQNYRSTPQILGAADALIRNNRGRKHKELFTTNEGGSPVRVLTCRDERQEAKEIVDRFNEHHIRDGAAWSSMAVFYRMNSLSRVMEDAFRDAGIPYQIARGTAFYERKEIKDLVAYLRTIANAADEVNLFRIINLPTRGISKKTIEAMQAYALANNVSIDRVLDEPMQLTNVTTRAQSALTKFGSIVRNWRNSAGITASSLDESALLMQPDLRTFVENVIRESGLHEHYGKDKSDPDQERLANLGEFVTFAQQFDEDYEEEYARDGGIPLGEKLVALLEKVSLVSDADAVDSSSGVVTLMTLHAAKGLEYPVVAMVGVEDGLLPHERAEKETGDVEEERRLMFVGITRAMGTLYLSQARYRTVFGRTQPTIPSRFLKEIPEEYLELEDLASDGLAGDDRLMGGSRGDLAEKYSPGTLLRHPKFGLGRVLDVNAVGASTRARVHFNIAGPRTLILEYAKGLQIVDATGEVMPDADAFSDDENASDESQFNEPRLVADPFEDDPPF